MTDRISLHFETRKSILVLLVYILVAGSCWAQIPPVPPPTKAGCFALNGVTFKACGTSWTDYLGGVKYNCHCDCNSTGQDCIPAGSGSKSTPFDVIPSQLLPDGLAQGKAFYSPHQSKETEDWINDYWQKMRSLGVPVDVNSQLTQDDVPMTGDMKFDNFYMNQMMAYLNTIQGGGVDLRNKNGVVNPSDLKKQTVDAKIKQPVLQIPASNEVWYHLEPMTNGGIPPLPVSTGGNGGRNEHPAIDLVREAGVTAAGWLPGGAGYVGIVAVNIWAEDAKGIKDIMDGNEPPSTKTMLVNAFANSAVDVTKQAIGNAKEEAISKTFEYAYKSKGIAETIMTGYGINEKAKDLGGKVMGGEGEGIFGNITKAALWLGH
jgi:hypothetical protein